jgi:hypothetical protein
MNWVFRNTVAGIFMLLMALGCVTEIPEPVSFEEKLAERGFTMSQPVSRLKLVQAGRMTDWNFVDGGAAIIYFGTSRYYLVTVRSVCEDKLRNAKRIRLIYTTGITTKLNKLEIVGRSVPGSSRLYCEIDAIHELKKIEMTDTGN